MDGIRDIQDSRKDNGVSSIYDILVFGDCVVDIVIKIKGKEEGHVRLNKALMTCGGACNFAIVASRLGLKVAVFDKVGRDFGAKLIEETLKAENVDPYLTVGEFGTSMVLILHSPNENPQFMVYMGSGFAMEENEIPPHLISMAKAIYVTGYLLIPGSKSVDAVMKTLKTAKSHGLITFFDPGITIGDVNPKFVDLVLENTDYLLANEDELKDIVKMLGIKKAHEIVESYKMSALVIKQGDKGTYVIGKEEEFKIPAFSVGKLIDPIGAGDAFNAGFAYGILRGMKLQKAAILGNILGGIKVTKFGTGIMMPTKEELLEQLKKLSMGELLHEVKKC